MLPFLHVHDCCFSHVAGFCVNLSPVLAKLCATISFFSRREHGCLHPPPSLAFESMLLLSFLPPAWSESGLNPTVIRSIGPVLKPECNVVEWGFDTARLSVSVFFLHIVLEVGG